jgi:uncharacterized protein YndB with AHSA1/START domain
MVNVQQIPFLYPIHKTPLIMPPTGKAQTIKKTFSRETSVAIDINASPEAIWELLTDAAGYPDWNSTILSLEGDIAPGNTIKLKSTLDPKRIFKLKIKEFQPHQRLVWGDAMGKRIFTLTDQGEGTTRFSMSEKIGGPLFPLFAGMIPSFDEAFEAFAGDLKRAAEE